MDDSVDVSAGELLYHFGSDKEFIWWFALKFCTDIDGS